MKVMKTSQEALDALEGLRRHLKLKSWDNRQYFRAHALELITRIIKRRGSKY